MRLMTFAALAVYFVACAAPLKQTNHATPLPISTRADTRNFVGFRFDTTIVSDNQIYTMITDALPNETSMCFYGYAKDTTLMVLRRVGPGIAYMVEMVKKIAIVDSIAPANIEKSNSVSIFYKNGIGCDPNPRLIAMGHTHPLQNPAAGKCDHSQADALFAHDRQAKYWFMLVFCPYRTSILWADGRRSRF